MDINVATAAEAVEISDLRLGDRVAPGPFGPWWVVREFRTLKEDAWFTAVNERGQRIEQGTDTLFPFFTHRDENAIVGDIEEVVYPVRRAMVPHGGRYGLARFKQNDGVELYALDPEYILRRRLGDGAQIRVTVHVVNAGSPAERRKLAERREGTRRVVG